MGIDRIGKGAPPPVAPETKSSSALGAGATKETFSVDQAGAKPKPEGIDPASASSPLARLRAGEIDVNGYVDLKVDEATHALHGLSPAELADIKKVLRDQIATDPGLADLVRQATGKAPDVPEE